MIALSCHLRGSKLLAQHRILESSVATNTLSRLATKGHDGSARPRLNGTKMVERFPDKP